MGKIVNLGKDYVVESYLRYDFDGEDFVLGTPDGVYGWTMYTEDFINLMDKIALDNDVSNPRKVRVSIHLLD